MPKCPNAPLAEAVADPKVRDALSENITIVPRPDGGFAIEAFIVADVLPAFLASDPSPEDLAAMIGTALAEILVPHIERRFQGGQPCRVQ